jgi:predicted HicB family RNase H-like nuclease
MGKSDRLREKIMGVSVPTDIKKFVRPLKKMKANKKDKIIDCEKLAKQYPFDLSLVSLDGKEMNYVVKFKEYPDIIGTGASAKEAIDEAYGNLSVLLEYLSEQSKTIIPPSVHIVTEEPSGRITLRMSKTLHAHLIERADQEGMSVNSIVNEALAKFLYEKEEKTNVESKK